MSAAKQRAGPTQDHHLPGAGQDSAEHVAPEIVRSHEVMQRGTLQPCGRILRRVVVWGHQWAEDRHEYEEREDNRAHQGRGMATEPAQ